MKRKLWIIPVLAALIALLACGTALADQSGACGDNLTWTLTDYGKLTISGTGKMTNYYFSSSVPWYSSRSSVRSIFIEDGVTSISRNAFQSCVGVTSVIIPASVEEIGYRSFSGCSSLTEATILNWKAEIGDSDYDVFDNCASGFTLRGFSRSTAETYAENAGHNFMHPKCGSSNLTWDLSGGTLTLSGSGAMPYLSGSTAAPWYSLRDSIFSIEVKSGVTSISNYAFYGCSIVTDAVIPVSVTNIGYVAFKNCSLLNRVTICNSGAVIGDSDHDVFDGCSSELVVHGWTGSTAETYAEAAGITFESLGALSGQCGDEVYYSIDSVTGAVSITGSGPMWDYESFTDTTALDPFFKNKTITSVVIGSGVTSIGESTFYGCSNLAGITIPNSVTSIGYAAFHDCTSLTGVTIPDSVTVIGGAAFYQCTDLVSVTIPNGVTTIENQTFYRCSSLTAVTIPNSVTSIRNSAFSECSSLTAVTIPNSVTSIGFAAFRLCSALTAVTIPDNVTSIDDSAFSKCRNLNSIQVAGGNTVYASVGGVLYDKQKTTLLAYPAGKTGMFTVPDSVTSIKEEAFVDCSGLTGITIPDSVTSIKYNTFTGCTGLTNIIIPDSVTSIGIRAFEHCESLTDITIPGSITSIESGVFYYCTGLTSITIPDSVTSIGELAFGDCTSLNSVTIPNSVTSIGAAAFFGCESLTSVTIPDSVTGIGNGVFYYCTALTGISIPRSVTSIGNNVFQGCGNLAYATVHNAETTFGKDVFLDTAAGFKLRGHSGSTAETYAGANSHIFEVIAAEMGTPDFSFPAGLTRIETEAFSGARMTVVYIPDSVTFLGSKAFANCTNLTQIRIPAGITTIPADAFQNVSFSKLTIFGAPGSAAETFANTAGYKFEIE